MSYDHDALRLDQPVSVLVKPMIDDVAVHMTDNNYYVREFAVMIHKLGNSFDKWVKESGYQQRPKEEKIQYISFIICKDTKQWPFTSFCELADRFNLEINFTFDFLNCTKIMMTGSSVAAADPC